MTSTSKLVSIVAPFYNEGEAVDSFYQALRGVLDGIPAIRFEVICVDDGSRDDTLQRLVALIDRDPRFSIIELSRNFGKEAALTAGLDAAKGDAVIPIDADLQDPPELIPALIAAWQKGADVVLARRKDRDSDTFLKKSTARLFYRLHNWLSQVQIPADVGDFRLMDRSVLEALKQLPERQRFMKGLFAWVGFKQVGVDYARQSRVTGTTKWRYWKLWNFAIDGITGSSTVPLRVWTYFGMSLGLGAIAYSLWLFVHTLFYGNPVPGYASLMVTVLFLGSLNIVATGILGEYVGRIYSEVRNRPLYLVREMRGLEDRKDPSQTWNGTSLNASISSKATTGGSARAARS